MKMLSRAAAPATRHRASRARSWSLVAMAAGTGGAGEEVREGLWMEMWADQCV